MQAVTAATTAALRMIAAESPINERRVRPHGISLVQGEDPPDEAGIENEPIE